jgi:AraC family transcriptional regulator
MYKPEVSVSELSLQFEFTSNSSFTRSFKKFYGISPSEFRKKMPHRFSKISQPESKNGQENGIFEKYLCNITNLKTWIKMNAKVAIKEMPKLNLACITSIGVNGISNAYDALLKWATPNGLLNNSETKMVTIYQDNFKITSPDKVRISACIQLKKAIKTSGRIHLTSIEEGKYIVGHFEIALHEFEKSWSSLFIWMNENGYKKADRNPFEIYYNNFHEHPEKKSILDFCIPIL